MSVVSEVASQITGRAVDHVRSGARFEELFHECLDILDAHQPSDLWDRYRRVDLDAEVRSTVDATIELLGEHPMPDDVNGVWFGLYELSSEPEDTLSSVIDLNGGPKFPEPEWLFNLTWQSPSYLPTPALRSFAEPAKALDGEADWLVTYALTLAFSVGLIEAVLGTEAAQALCGSADQVGVAVGFHDGDILQLGTVSPAGKLDSTLLSWI